MILVIGGVAQGKLAFAREKLGVTSFSDGVLGEENAVYRLHEAVRCGIGKEELDAYLARHSDAVLICDEVGCGIVPMTRAEREWREQVGRLCCYLAGRAEQVYRVFCGIGTRIK